MQAIHVGNDLFEGALIRLLDPSRMSAVFQNTAHQSEKRGTIIGAAKKADKRDHSCRVGEQVSIVEVLSTSAVSVRWSNPLAGHISDQVWHCVIARRRTSCLLTGATIRRGDRVYQPRVRGGRVPCNWDRMIRAEAMQGLLERPSV